MTSIAMPKVLSEFSSSSLLSPLESLDSFLVTASYLFATIKVLVLFYNNDC